MRQRNPGVSGTTCYCGYGRACATAMRNRLRETPQALSRRNCELMPGRLTGDDYDPAKRHPEESQIDQ